MSDTDPNPLTTAEAIYRLQVAAYRFLAAITEGLRLSPEHWERQADAADVRRWAHREETLRGLSG